MHAKTPGIADKYIIAENTDSIINALFDARVYRNETSKASIGNAAKKHTAQPV